MQVDGQGWGFKSGSVAGFESRALGDLVQGSQQVTALEKVQVALQWDVDLTVVTGQLWQTGGPKRRPQQTTSYTLSLVRRHRVILGVDAALLRKGFLICTTHLNSWILRLPVLLQRAEN